MPESDPGDRLVIPWIRRVCTARLFLIFSGNLAPQVEAAMITERLEVGSVEKMSDER